MTVQQHQEADESAAAAVESHADAATAATAPTDDRSGGRNINRDNNSTKSQYKRFSDFSTASDEEFRRILKERLDENPLSKDYPDIFEKAPDCFVKWRQRFSTSNPRLWKRLFDTDRVLKEFFEAVPVLDAVYRMIDTDTRLRQEEQEHEQDPTKPPQTYTIIDLCSGKGYLGMILSEILPPSKVFRIVLMDKAWPMRNAPMESQHINWDHIYGTYNNPNSNERKEAASAEQSSDGAKSGASAMFCQEIPAPRNDNNIDDDEKEDDSSNIEKTHSYYDTWPIPIDTSKQNLKSSRQLQQIENHYLSNPAEHPVILLAIHLCGTLSLRAIELFNTNPTIKFLALKPCCLPGMIHAKRHELFTIGTHVFEASEVCIHGKWKKNKWENGPPRSHLKPKFKKWSEHLYKGIGWNDATETNNKATAAAIKEEQHQKHNNHEAAKDNEAVKPQTHPEEEAPFQGTAATSSSSTTTATTSTAAAFAIPRTCIPATDHDDKIRKVHAKVRVQHDGGFQNDFLFAERMPISSATVWHGLETTTATRHSSSEVDVGIRAAC